MRYLNMFRVCTSDAEVIDTNGVYSFFYKIPGSFLSKPR